MTCTQCGGRDAIEYDGKTVVFWGAFGCGVVHREVVVPSYHDEGARP